MPAKKEKTEKSEKTAKEKPVKTGKSTHDDKAEQGIVKSGDKVKVHYTGTFDDGNVFDSSEKHGQPLEFEIGAKQVIPGFENAIIGMKLGEEKSIRLEPSEAYGDINPQLTKKIERDHLPKDQEPKTGMILVINLPNGMQIPARIVEVTDKDVTIDLNHPLAGKTLNFKFKVIEINA
jgi:peptidylprolyl isomerase